MGASIFLWPLVTNAGALSFINDLFKTDQAQAQKVEVKSESSQTIDLPEAAINPDPNPIKNTVSPTIVGEAAFVAESGPEGTSADIQSKTISSDHISVYVVHPSDTLAQIAKMFNVSPNTILWANDLTSAKDIKPGQSLVILPVSGIKYSVKKGDTIESIAKKFKGDAQDITKFNDFDSDQKLVIGDTVIIPDGEMVVVVKKPTIVVKGAGMKIFKDDGSLVKTFLANTTGYFMRPITGGMRTQGLHGNNGVDLASSCGASVMAAAGGKVILSREGGWNGGYGNYIVISHSNGTQTLYGHLQETKVSAGESVDKGEVIGLMGSTGNSTGCHLHWEVRGGRNPLG